MLLKLRSSKVRVAVTTATNAPKWRTAFLELVESEPAGPSAGEGNGAPVPEFILQRKQFSRG